MFVGVRVSACLGGARRTVCRTQLPGMVWTIAYPMRIIRMKQLRALMDLHVFMWPQWACASCSGMCTVSEGVSANLPVGRVLCVTFRDLRSLRVGCGVYNVPAACLCP